MRKPLLSSKEIAFSSIFGCISALSTLTTSFIPAPLPGLYAAISIPVSTLIILVVRTIIDKMGSATFTQFVSGVVSMLLPGGPPIKWLILPSWIAGGIIIIFGLHFLKVLNISFLERGPNINIKKKDISPLRAFFLGLSFALVWSPCIGPILGSILLLASSSFNAFKAALLLFTYSLGMGIPFILSALFLNYFINFLKNYHKVEKFISRLSGILLIGIGILIVFGKFELLEKLGG